MSAARKEYTAEYSASGRATCKRCYRTIDQGELRAGHAVRSSYHDGYDTSYYHWKCVYSIPGMHAVAGWEKLRWEDQLEVRKTANDKTNLSTDLWKRRKADNDELWKLVDQFDELDVAKAALKELLVANGLSLEDAKGKKKKGPDEVLFEAAEGLLFGLQAPCSDCKTQGLMTLDGELWKCNGWLTAYTRCQWTGTDVQRQVWVIPPALVKKAPILGTWKPPAEIAARPRLPKGGASVPAAAGGSGEIPVAACGSGSQDVSMTAEFWPVELIPKNEELSMLTIAFVGSQEKTAAELEVLVTEHGGNFSKDVPAKGEVDVLIATEDEIAKPAKKRTKKTQNATKWGVPILKYEWLINLVERKEEGLKLRTKAIASKYALEGEVTEEFPQVPKMPKRKTTESEEVAVEPAAKKKRRAPISGEILKIDSASGKEKDGKVFVQDDIAYHAMLNQADIATGANKYYRLQIIKHKEKSVFWIFCKWGRIGTFSGDSRTYEKRSANTAIEFFVDKFKDLTGNEWDNRDNFKKLPGRYSMVELEGNEIIGEEGTVTALVPSGGIPAVVGRPEAKGCTLQQEVQDMVKLIFDADMMKKTMENMSMDTQKMPLGKLSMRTINDAYKVLTELQNLLKSAEPTSSKVSALLADASNRFYHLIPHNFGERAPPVISTLAVVQQKTDMLSTLMDLEAAATLMKTNEGASASSGKHPIDVNYESLGVRLKHIPKDSDMFEMIAAYVKNTHAATHSQYNLRVDEAFELEKDILTERFKKFDPLPNHQLLWHGSRLANWVGILSQGLRIAPPEAPATGYMFGKGVYFADMVSKSANYCFTDPKNSTGLLLLSQIALGSYYERTSSEFVTKLPDGTHSCKGVGQTFPDPKEFKTIYEKVHVPLGKPSTDAKIKSSLLYNEFIVYDTAQILPRFLLRTSFIYKK